MSAPQPPPPIEPGDWNFDSIPDHHLIACCYWEYARESTFLRGFKSRCVEANRNLKPFVEAFELCGKDARRVLSIGDVANSFLLGFGFEPNPAPSGTQAGLAAPKPGAGGPAAPKPGPHDPITGNFPASWQSLSAAERDYRAHLAAGATSRHEPPFQRASGAAGVNALLFMTNTIVSSLAPLPDHLYHQTLQDQLDLFNSCADPNNSVHPIVQSSKFDVRRSKFKSPPLAVPPLLRLDTHSRLADELALVQIQWAGFTDDEIVDSFRAWLKANRPTAVGSTTARGHKLKDWRANLTRLAVMRLLTRFSALELLDSKADELQALRATTQFSGPTWLDIAKWHDARREARQTFHQLFPFLPPSDAPLSWPTAHSRSST
jgi:hypothetical protein